MNGRKWTGPSIENGIKIKDIDKYDEKDGSREENPESSGIE